VGKGRSGGGDKQTESEPRGPIEKQKEKRRGIRNAPTTSVERVGEQSVGAGSLKRPKHKVGRGGHPERVGSKTPARQSAKF